MLEPTKLTLDRPALAVEHLPLRGLVNENRGQRGQAMVEFALLLPVLMLLVFGGVEFGRALWYKNEQTGLAGQAARYAAVNRCAGCGAQTVSAYILGQYGKPGATVVFRFTDPGPRNHCKGEPVKATILYPFTFVTQMWGPLVIGSSAVQRLEQNWGTSTGAFRPGVDVFDATGASADAC